MYRSRPCYAGIGEYSVYVHRDARGIGAGKAVLQALFTECESRGFWKLVSRILTENVEELHRLAAGLLEYETLSGDELRTVLRGEKVIRTVVDDPAPENRRASVPSAGRPARP